MVKNSARMVKHEIPFSVLFTRLSAAIVTKTGKHLAAQFNGAGIDVFKCSLIDREAFKSIFSFGGSVNNLEAKDKKSQASRGKAAANAQLFAEEVKQHLKVRIEKQQVEKEVLTNV